MGNDLFSGQSYNYQAFNVTGVKKSGAGIFLASRVKILRFEKCDRWELPSSGERGYSIVAV